MTFQNDEGEIKRILLRYSRPAGGISKVSMFATQIPHAQNRLFLLCACCLASSSFFRFSSCRLRSALSSGVSSCSCFSSCGLVNVAVCSLTPSAADDGCSVTVLLLLLCITGGGLVEAVFSLPVGALFLPPILNPFPRLGDMA